MFHENLDPADFGISLSREDFADQMADGFYRTYRGHWTVDDLLLHPREAANFCDEVRRRHAYHDVPDHIILRAILTRQRVA